MQNNNKKKQEFERTKFDLEKLNRQATEQELIDSLAFQTMSLIIGRKLLKPMWFKVWIQPITNIHLFCQQG